ncbi:hypothetical protein COOONC_07304 [Cooperia oncophora]
MRLFLVSFLVLFYFDVSSCFNVDNSVVTSFKIDLDSKLTCFYQALKRDMSLAVYVDPSVSIQVSTRLTSPSGDFSEWMHGEGKAVHMTHNVTENGDYEICIAVPYQAKVLFHLFAFNPNEQLAEVGRIAELTELEKNLSISVRDEALQQKNSDFIKTYVVLFCISAVIATIVQVTVVRRMFRIDPSRIRI